MTDSNTRTERRIIPLPSGAQSSRVKFVILHHTALNLEASKRALSGPNAKVSAHYLIDTNGDRYVLVPEEKMSWHAGVSSWQTYANINPCSIGIEIVNLDGNLNPYPRDQIDSVIELCVDIKTRYSMKEDCFIGHSDIAVGRKIDPGTLFPWSELNASGIGMWYGELSSGATFVDNNDFTMMTLLGKIGYNVVNFTVALTAFRRHFNPADINQPAYTANDIMIASALVRKYR